MTQAEQKGQALGTYARPTQDFNVIKIRLDTKPLLEDIEIFLRGSKDIITQDAEGKILIQKVEMGKPKMNEEGIRDIINWVTGTVNSQVVQGNFPCTRDGKSETYDKYIQEYQIELTSHLILNVPKWQMEDSEIDGIISFIMLLIIPFMSRLIGNKERDSYADTIRTVDTSSSVQKSGGFKLFKQ